MRKKIDLLILVTVIALGAVAVFNAQNIGDWYHSMTYDPPEEIVEIADGAAMSDEGRKLFYRFSPKVFSATDISSLCGEGTLGCAEGQSIYISAYANDREYNQSVVTAAHEMLHVAYSRLSDEEKHNVDNMLETQLKNPLLKDVVKKLTDYPEADYFNEAHSYVGTEVASLNSELEDYYDTYFADRSKVVDAYKASPINRYKTN